MVLAHHRGKYRNPHENIGVVCLFIISGLPRKGKAMKKKITVPSATRLKSGRWRVQLRIDGQSTSITRDTEREAVAEAMAVKAGIMQPRVKGEDMLLKDAISDYIEAREHVKSPSTIAGYKVIQRNRFPQLQNVRLKDLPSRWQKAVDQERMRVSPKTVKNSALFIHSVVHEACGITLTCSLPQVVVHEHPWLEPDQIQTFLDAIRGNPYEIPMLLALSGLRKSEIAAVRWNDIDLKKGTISVHGSAVVDSEGKMIDREENKNVSSNRTVRFLIPQLREAVAADQHRPEDYVYHKITNALNNNINKVCQSAGLPRVGVHGLRHTFASLCAHLKIPENITMQMGGWSDPTTIRKIYTHIARKDVLTESAKFEDFFNNAHAIAHEGK